MIGTGDLLGTWEAGIAASGAHRALLLHALARPADDADRLLAVPVGERDADLLALRQALFGERANVRLQCSECAEDLEFDFDVRQVLAAGDPAGPGHGPAGPARPAGPDSGPAGPGHDEAPGPIEVTAGPWTVRLRLPTAGDLLAAAQAPPGQARATLLARCVLDAREGERHAETAELPAEVQERVAEAAAAADPRADVTFNVPCPACGHSTRALLDPAAFIWAELDTWARATLLEIHLLASTYGWSEADVLAVSAVRRRHYLELAGHA